jgi:UDP-GlcNAc:undecaprenyl-phosphate GlcNAc-1-phosphate transferase
VAAIATLFGVAGTGLARILAIRLGIMDQPNPIVPDHRHAVPYLGGLGLLGGAFLALAVAGVAGLGSATGTPLWLLAGGALFLAIGLVDDLHELGAALKMALQVAAAIAVVALGLPVPSITGIAPVDAAIAIVWLVGVVNAVNVIDVCDGLAASVALVTFGAFALTGGPDAGVAAALAGSCLGFLYWNRPRARIFMGDAGSLFLGFFVGALALTARPGESGPWPLLPMLVLFAGVPIFDLAFQSLTRAREGRAWYKGGPDSFALRLQQAGLSKGQVDLLASLAALVLWGCAYVLPALPLPAQVVLLGIVAVVGAITWRRLLRYRVAVRPAEPFQAVMESR